MRLTQVNGAAFSLPVLEAAVRQTAQHGNLELQAANGSASESHTLEYHDGLKYPHLQRDPSKPDLLQLIVGPQTRAPLATRPATP